MNVLFRDCTAYIKRRPGYVCLTVLAMVAAFGFYVTNYTLNVDDIFTEFYNGGRLIAAGRFTGYLMQWLVGCMTYSPFFTMFLALCLFFFAGLLYVQVLSRTSEEKLSDAALFVFWIVFLTYPIISEQMVYPILPLLSLGYAFVAISLYLLDDFMKNKSWGALAIAGVLMALTIDFYEAFASVFLTLLTAIILVKFLYADNRDSVRFKSLFWYMVQAVVFLVAAIAVRMVLSKMALFLYYGTFQSGYSGNAGVYWFDIGVIDCAIWLLRTLFLYYGWAAVDYFAVFVYVAAVLIGVILTVILAFKRRSFLPVLIYAVMIAASLSLSFLLGLAANYTMAQALVVLVAFTAMLLYTMAEKKTVGRIIVTCLVTLLVLNQAKSLNTWSVINYERYDYEASVVDHIGQTLESNHSVDTKPVIFIGSNDTPKLPSSLTERYESDHPLVKWGQSVCIAAADKLLPAHYYESIGGFYNADIDINNATDLFDYIKQMRNRAASSISYLSWAKKYPSWFSVYEPQQVGRGIYEWFENRGYELIRCTEEQYLKVADSYNDYPAYPKNGCIIETEDYILVNFG